MPSISVLKLLHTYAHSRPNNGSKRTHYRLIKGPILLNNVVLKLNFQREGHLYANCLIYTLTIYHKCLLFQFLGCGIHMRIPILTGV